MSIEDITPEDSEAPTYLDSTPASPSPDRPTLGPEELIAAQVSLRESAVQKLIRGQRLTEEEARLLLGG